MSRKDELNIYRRLKASQSVAELDGRVSPQQPYGVLLSLGDRPLGLWSVLEDQYVFRELGSYEPCLRFDDLQGVHQQTIELLKQCRHGWAEQFGQPPRPDPTA